MHHLQKNYLECIKTGKNDSKFTIDKYHLNIMEFIKLFPVNIFMPVTKFPRLTILLFCKKQPFRIFGQFKGAFQRNQWQKLGILHLERKEEKKQELLS